MNRNLYIFKSNHLLKSCINNISSSSISGSSGSSSISIINSINNIKNIGNCKYSSKAKKRPYLIGFQDEVMMGNVNNSVIKNKSKRNETVIDKPKSIKLESKSKKSLNTNKEVNLSSDNSENNKKELFNPNFAIGGGVLSKYQASKFIKNKWMKRHLTDPFLKEASFRGLVSRAGIKLININKQLRLLKPKMVVVDLGASPGSWTQVAKSEVTKSGLVISVDINDKYELEGKDTFIQGDFTLKTTQDRIVKLAQKRNLYNLRDFLKEEKGKQLEQRLSRYSSRTLPTENDKDESYGDGDGDGEPHGTESVLDEKQRVIDVVLSDMAPHYSGIQQVDHARLMDLQNKAFEFCLRTLKNDGSFVCKVSRGGEEKQFFKLLEKHFTSVKTMKPEASRKESTEIYYIGRGFVAPIINSKDQ